MCREPDVNFYLTISVRRLNIITKNFSNNSTKLWAISYNFTKANAEALCLEYIFLSILGDCSMNVGCYSHLSANNHNINHEHFKFHILSYSHKNIRSIDR